MSADLFDPELRALRRDRAFRIGPELFLYERAFSDCIERFGLIDRRFGSALLIGCPDPGWPDRLRDHVDRVEVLDPGPFFARAAGGAQVVEDQWPGSTGHDICVAVGTLDTVNDLPRALRSVQASLAGDALFIGAMAGGDTLPKLRMAMRAADEAQGGAVAHIHPRIEPAALAGLLSAAGFAEPVVDIDRVDASYRSFDRLIGDLRAMGATNILRARSRAPLLRSARKAAERAFAAAGKDGRTVETFEILHFAAWTSARPQQG